MKIDRDIERIRKKLGAVHAKVDRLRARQALPLVKRLDELTRKKREAEQAARRLSEAKIVAPRWRRYLAGKVATVYVAQNHCTRKRSEVTPLYRCGDWCVHQAVGYGVEPDYGWPRYALTHGPSGLCAERSDDLGSMEQLAKKLAAAVPDFDAQAPTTSAATKRCAAIVRAARDSNA